MKVSRLLHRRRDDGPAGHDVLGPGLRGRLEARPRLLPQRLHVLPRRQPGGQHQPERARPKAEWATYLKADKHAKGKDTVKQYVSKAYRASIKASNKAAEKFADVPDQELAEDIKAFLLKGAKDGDAPASCS